MKKSKQVGKEAKKETGPVATSPSNDNYVDINVDDLEPLSDTTDFKSLLTQSFDISKTLVKNVGQLNTSHDLFLLDAHKLCLSLKCKGFYKNFLDDQDFEINNYFNQNLIELFDSKEKASREKFFDFQLKNLKADQIESKTQANVKDEISLKSIETKEQNIEDWLDELID